MLQNPRLAFVLSAAANAICGALATALWMHRLSDARVLALLFVLALPVGATVEWILGRVMVPQRRRWLIGLIGPAAGLALGGLESLVLHFIRPDLLPALIEKWMLILGVVTGGVPVLGGSQVRPAPSNKSWSGP